MKNVLLLPFCLLCACAGEESTVAIEAEAETPSISEVAPTLIVLGNVQDAGSPHIACQKECCRDLFQNPDPERQVTTLGLIDPTTEKTFLFEASPDMPRQAKALSRYAGSEPELPNGIFLTHAHIGHYTGLMYLGKEATNAENVPVYAMPRMRNYLTTNGPWSQLVSTGNIILQPLTADSTIRLTPNLTVTPFRVPHRDEYSETVGYRIDGPAKSCLFIPDIDKWEKWDRQIEDLINAVDYAFLDGTFYNAAELNTRDISQIPHPFVSESMARFAALSVTDKQKVHFIHFNHTNRLLDAGSVESGEVVKNGFEVARYGAKFEL